MRKFLFWLLIVIIVLMVALIGYASYHHTTPRAVLENMFSSSPATTNTQTSAQTSGTNNQSGSDVSVSGGLSTQDKADVKDLMNSLNVQ